VYDKIW